MADKIKPPLRQAAAIALIGYRRVGSGAVAGENHASARSIVPNPNGAAAPVCVPFAAIPGYTSDSEFY